MHEKWGAANPGSSWKGSAGVFGQDWGALCSPLSLAEPGCARLAGRQSSVSLAVAARGKGLQPPLLPQRLISGTCSDLREEEGLKRTFSLCPFVGNGGVSFSHLDLTFWNHFYIFLISLSLLFPYLIALLSSFWFCFLSSISRFPLLPSVFPYSSSSLAFILFPKLFFLLNLKICVSFLKPGYGAPFMQDIAMTALGSLLPHAVPLLSSQFLQFLAGQTEEGLYHLSHKLPL